MPIYFLHLHDGVDMILDRDGIERPTLDSAVAAALAGAREIMGHDIRNGVLDLSGRVDVEDEAHRIVHTVRFTDAVRVSGMDATDIN